MIHSPRAALQITKHCRLMIPCYAGTTSSGNSRSVILTQLVDQSTGMVATAPAPATTVVTHGIISMMESPGQSCYKTAVTSRTEYITWAPPALTQDSTCRYSMFFTLVLDIIDQKTGSQNTPTPVSASMTPVMLTPTGARIAASPRDPSARRAPTPRTSPARGPGCVSTPRCCAMATPSASLARTRPSPPVWTSGSATDRSPPPPLSSAPASSIPAVQPWPRLVMARGSVSTMKMRSCVRSKVSQPISWLDPSQ